LQLEELVVNGLRGGGQGPLGLLSVGGGLVTVAVIPRDTRHKKQIYELNAKL
jgi:hypothetical protein